MARRFERTISGSLEACGVVQLCPGQEKLLSGSAHGYPALEEFGVLESLLLKPGLFSPSSLTRSWLASMVVLLSMMQFFGFD